MVISESLRVFTYLIQLTGQCAGHILSYFRVLPLCCAPLKPELIERGTAVLGFWAQRQLYTPPQRGTGTECGAEDGGPEADKI